MEYYASLWDAYQIAESTGEAEQFWELIEHRFLQGGHHIIRLAQEAAHSLLHMLADAGIELDDLLESLEEDDSVSEEAFNIINVILQTVAARDADAFVNIMLRLYFMGSATAVQWVTILFDLISMVVEELESEDTDE